MTKPQTTWPSLSSSKMSDDLSVAIREGIERVKLMTPLQREEMHKAQSLSWTRQDND